MKYYKVYSRCCVRSKHISEITEEDALEILQNQTFENEDYGYNVDFDYEHEDPNDDTSDITQDSMDAFVSYVYEQLKKCLEKLGYVDCGDYRIVRLDDDEQPEIQNSCGTSMADFVGDFE